MTVRPRVPSQAKRGHVRVGAEARVAEEAPCAAEDGAGLEDGKGAVREGFAEDVGGVDSREAGADDEDVVVFGWDNNHLDGRC